MLLHHDGGHEPEGVQLHAVPAAQPAQGGGDCDPVTRQATYPTAAPCAAWIPGICETFGQGVAVHSSGELGIQLATMLHLGAVIPNLSFAADAHYHQLRDDLIVGGPLRYEGGAIAVPTGPGLGVKLDREKLREYHELFLELGAYPYDQDPLRPGWTPLIPNDRWADPADGRVPAIPV